MANDLIPALGIAVASIAFVPILQAANAGLAIVVEVLVGCAIVLAAPAYAPSVAIFIIFFQNLFVSILSSYLSTEQEMEFVKGYNFLLCAVMWLLTVGLYLLRERRHSPDIDRIMKWGMITLATVLLYCALGATQDPRAAIVYLRNIAFPLFLFQLALLTAATFEIRITPFLVAVAMLLIACGYTELLFRDFWLQITDGYTFWHFDELKATRSGTWEAEMRATGFVPVDLIDRFRFSFLNSPLFEDLGLSSILRIHGPNMSAISFGYGVAFSILFLFSVGHRWLALAAIPLLVLCSVKGALVTVIFVALAWSATWLLGPVITLVVGCVGLALYAIAAIYIGLQIGDFHVIGLMGGWDGFLQNPIGRGLGVGGNLSEGYFSIDWSAAQNAGTMDGAVESAVGVLLYQMGIAAVVPLGFFLAMALRAWRLYASTGILTQGLAAFGTLVVVVNGIFQEEALFAPPALGLMLCLTGLVIGHHMRTQSDGDAADARS
ncbi:hypothetical protein [Bradyrhizobium ivorense]|uniref:hypothetical protein n=1 Tax=Bradyrhizobium ivorense TaxID=2511166 RepID=UPI0010B31C6B|nr:hypothetical protein [Bradyrhizobium ivorense]VIO68351.1 hypothetical protein CI41S_14400 [Bradyrhizobium ivorense]